MAFQVRHPIWLPAVRPPGARTFASLYRLESFARASVAIPIQDYDILRDEQAVSILHTAVASWGLSATLFMPMLIDRFAPLGFRFQPIPPQTLKRTTDVLAKPDNLKSYRHTHPKQFARQGLLTYSESRRWFRKDQRECGAGGLCPMPRLPPQL
jgi:hypothetical protein